MNCPLSNNRGTAYTVPLTRGGAHRTTNGKPERKSLEMRARNGTATPILRGRRLGDAVSGLDQQSLGSPQKVTLARLEQRGLALTELKTREPAPLRPPVVPLSPSLGLDATEVSTGLQEHVLATKFLVPASSHALIPRPRLESLLQEGLRRPLTLVSAPAGFGKTTLLAQWVHSVRQRTLETHRVAWVSLDAADNSALRFWTYVLTALDTCEPGLATPALQVLQAPGVPALEEVLTTIINDLSQGTHSYVLILDDFDLVNDPAVHASMQFLVAHQPSQLHLIILTRTDPPLTLPRLRARGQLLEIRTEQLRCTAEEAAAFLQQVMGLELPPEALQEMIARTEGWLVGLQLLGLAVQAHRDSHDAPPLLSGTHRYLLDYFSEEVLGQQPAAVQRFLLRTSILEQCSASLCDVVTEQTDSQQMLEHLEQANVFVIPLDEQRRCYRYHALFAQALRARLEQEDAELIPALHLRASQWYEQQGHMSQAVQHVLQAKARQGVADLQPCTEPHLQQQDDQPARQEPERAAMFSRLSDQQRGQGPAPYLDTVLASRQEDAGTQPPQQALLDPLSERELQVLHLMAQGASNQEIAEALVLSVQTVKRHVQNILGKLQASNRTRAVMRAQSLGLLGLLTDEQRRGTTHPSKQNECEFLFVKDEHNARSRTKSAARSA
jgi:ATP/maltotriose-dependent transcriptional regulator MalT